MKGIPNNERAKLIKFFKKQIRSYQFILFLVCIGLIIMMSILSPYFFTIKNLKDVLLGASIIGIVSFGMTVVLINGGIDLSVGSVVALSSVILCVSINAGLSLPLALILTFSGGIIVGMVNGFFIGYLKINPFIITLGTMSLLRGIAYIIIGGRPLPFESSFVRSIGANSFLSIPIPIYILFLVFIVLLFLLKYTQFGVNIYATGASEEVSILAGINTTKNKLFVFCIMGFLSALAGFVLAARTSAGIPSAGEGYELDAITAAILGGTSLKGGEGNLFGTVLGIAIVQIIVNGQNLLQVPYFYQLVSKGVIVIVAMVIAYFRRGEAAQNTR